MKPIYLSEGYFRNRKLFKNHFLKPNSVCYSNKKVNNSEMVLSSIIMCWKIIFGTEPFSYVKKGREKGSHWHIKHFKILSWLNWSRKCIFANRPHLKTPKGLHHPSWRTEMQTSMHAAWDRWMPAGANKPELCLHERQCIGLKAFWHQEGTLALLIKPSVASMKLLHGRYSREASFLGF